MSKFSVEEIEPEETADHLFWERCAREGLIDDVGGVEWSHRMKGTKLASDEWVRRHRVTVEALEAAGEVTQALLDAVVARARHPPERIEPTMEKGEDEQVPATGPEVAEEDVPNKTDSMGASEVEALVASLSFDQSH